MLDKLTIVIPILSLLVFFFYKLKTTRNYLIILPLFYTFLCLWAALGLADILLSNSPFFIDTKQLTETYFIFLGSSICFYLGASLFNSSNKVATFKLNSLRNTLSLIPSKYISFLYISSIILFHIAYPIDAIYYRSTYSDVYGGLSQARTLFGLVINLTVFILPFHNSRWFRSLSLLILLILMQGLNKRSIIIIPILYLFGTIIRDMKVSYLYSFFMLSVTLFFGSLAFSFRHNVQQGVISNIIYLFQNGVNLESSFEGINYLFGYSFYATLITANFFDVTGNELLISLNPLPSSMVDIKTIVENHKISVFAPYSALGTLGSLGNIYVFIYYFITGLSFNWIRSSFPSRYSSMSILLLLFFISFTIFSVQYQLRTVTRFFYYSFFYFSLVKIASIFLYNMNKHHK